eukprot:4093412-Lingulodinium_polyedra.AAC.1
MYNFIRTICVRALHVSARAFAAVCGPRCPARPLWSPATEFEEAEQVAAVLWRSLPFGPAAPTPGSEPPPQGGWGG